jgi:hypothetical protein
MKLKNALLFGLLVPFIPATIMGFMGFGWYYLATWFMFYLAFGIFGEWLSVKFRGKTVSRDIADTPLWLFIFILISWVVFPVILMVHWAMMR